MAVSASEDPVYRFGVFELDPREQRLLANGDPIALTPKVFETLTLLVANAGRIVGKDELMSALWPRGFVDESNLTKHIWLIRKALGDGEHDARYIETVPKRGYRFVAAVERIAREAETPPPLSPSADSSAAASTPPARIRDTAPRSRRYRMFGIAAVLAGVAVAVALVVWRREAEHAQPPSTPGSAVAIVDFNNLSQNPKDAWLGPALTEMLATEIAVGGRLHALPGELVRPARSDLSTPQIGGYAPQSLALLRKRLGADYVLSGSYLVGGVETDSQDVRLDLALQDARDGRAIASLTRSGPVSELSRIVIDSGRQLRDRLGITGSADAELESTAGAQPPSADVARRIGFALDALHRYDPARARDELLDAVAEAPGYAPVYSYLAQAWAALGYDAKALAAAQQAAAHAQGLPREQQLEIQAQVYAGQHDWDKAIDTARALVALRPKNPEYRFRLIDTLLSGGKPDLAQNELAALTKIVDAGDPRIELVAAKVASARDDNKQQAVHAELALREARARDLTGLAAEAGTQLGIARIWIGDPEGGERALKEARADYARVGNPRGEAKVDQNLGNAYDGRDATLAREAYERALAGFRSIGDRNGEAAAYSNLARMLWAAGDRDGTETAVRKSLAIRRETADLVGQAWNLAALGSIQMDAAASDEAGKNLEEAIALDEKAGDQSHRAFTLMQYSDLLRLRGDLARAASICEQALAASRATPNGDTASAEFQCAQIALDRGNVNDAQGGAEHARTSALALHNNIIAIDGDLLVAGIAMGQRRWGDAIPRLQRAVTESTGSELTTSEAIAESQLAVCYATLGRGADRDRAAARAKALRSRITERQEIFAVDIALADVRGLAGDRSGAVAALNDLAADADRRQWIAWALESRLTAVELAPPPAASLRDAVRTTAREHGFAWVLARLAELKPEARVAGS